jgi:hypothetical protein
MDTKKEAMLTAIQHLKKVVLHMNSMEILTTLSVDYSVSKTQSELLVSRPKGRKLLHQDTERSVFIFFEIAKMYAKNFSPNRTTWYFVMKFALLKRLTDTSTIQLSGSCLLTLQKLA